MTNLDQSNAMINIYNNDVFLDLGLENHTYTLANIPGIYQISITFKDINIDPIILEYNITDICPIIVYTSFYENLLLRILIGSELILDNTQNRNTHEVDQIQITYVNEFTNKIIS
jgi:hypothetical protein